MTPASAGAPGALGQRRLDRARGPPAAASGASRATTSASVGHADVGADAEGRARARASIGAAGSRGVSRTGRTSGAGIAEGAHAEALEDRRARPLVGDGGEIARAATSRSSAGCRRRPAPASRCASRARGGSDRGEAAAVGLPPAVDQRRPRPPGSAPPAGRRPAAAAAARWREAAKSRRMEGSGPGAGRGR